MATIFKREPALTLGLISAGLSLAAGFGLPITPAQVGLLTAFIAAVMSFVIRSQVYPTPTVMALIKTAIAKPSNTTVATVLSEQAAKDEAKP